MCGAAAPRKVLDAIANAEKKPKPVKPPQPWGQWKYGAPGEGNHTTQMQRKLDALEKKLSAIQRENKKLKEPANGETDSSGVDQTIEDGVDIKELQMFYDMARKLFKEDDDQVVAAKKRLDDARATANGRKPLAKRISTMEFKIAKAKRNYDKAEEEVRKSDMAIADLQSMLEKQKAAAVVKKVELDSLESELKNLLNNAVAEEPALPQLPQELAGDIKAAVSEVQRLDCVVRALTTTSPENLPAVGESLRAIVAALAKALPQATTPPVTQQLDEGAPQETGVNRVDEADNEESDDDVDEFLDTFTGLEVDGNSGTSGCGSEQRRTQFKQFLAKNRYVKAKGKRQHG
jgi:chromosome segregation ATPase